MPRSSIPAEVRREQIINAAIELFSDVGYRSTSLRDIAAHVGITHPGLLYHFHTKEELLQTVLDRRDADNRKRFDLDPTLHSPRELLTLILRQVAVATSENSGMIELFATLSAEATSKDHPAHDYFRERYASFVGGCVGVLNGLAATGELKFDFDHELYAQSWIALWEGLQIQWLYDHEVDIKTPLFALVNAVLKDPIVLTAS